MEFGRFMKRRDSRFLLFGTGPSTFDYRGLGLFALVYFGAFLVAGILAWPVWWLVQWWAAAGSELAIYLSSKSFDRYVDRLRMLFTALAVLWLIRRCGLWGRFGFQWREGGLPALLTGFSVGSAMFAGMILLQWTFLDVRLSLPGFGVWWKTVGGLILGAMILAWLEEAIFRGMLLRLFYTAMRPWPAVLGSSLVFAIVHFKRVPWDTEAAVTLWLSLGIAMKGVVSFVYTFDLFHFLNLFLAGIMLNLWFLRSGNLLGCLGLHAGWVWLRNGWGEFAGVNHGDPLTFWLGGRGVVDGVLPLAVLGMAIVILLCGRRSPKRDESAFE